MESAILELKERDNGHMIGKSVIICIYLLFYRNTNLP